MSSAEKVRIDKWLWAVRIFKTRSIAAEACKKGKVSINGVNVKSSREVKINDVIDIKFPPIVRSYKVLDISGKRMGAKLTPGFVREVTASDQIELLEMNRLKVVSQRPKGLGRPTKKDRRQIEDFTGGEY